MGSFVPSLLCAYICMHELHVRFCGVVLWVRVCQSSSPAVPKEAKARHPGQSCSDGGQPAQVLVLSGEGASRRGGND